MKKAKNNLDERQELKLLHIESRACWFAYWGLLVCICVQMIFDLNDPKSLAGEWIIFMLMSLYMAAACIKNGIWDRKLKPTPKTNLLVSIAAGGVLALVLFCTSYINYRSLGGSLAIAVFMFIFTSALCFGGLLLTSKIFKTQVQKLEQEQNEE